MELAENVAQKSLCLRRKYGSVVVYDTNTVPTVKFGFNERLGRCCNGTICVRDRYHNDHGERIEQGAEIHSEAVTLLQGFPLSYRSATFYLAGYDSKGTLLKGDQVRPCHYCAMLLKYRGFKNIVIKEKDDSLAWLSVDAVIEEQELAWQPDV